MFLAALLSFAAAKPAGGVVVINPKITDENVVFASNAINEFFLEQDKDAEPKATIEVLHATQQVVAGILFKFTLKMNSGGENQICKVSVWSRSWLQKPESLTSSDISCKAEHLLGGDDHDYLTHGTNKPLIGGDDHDYLPHGTNKPLIGGDDHDYLPHGTNKPLIGGDDHDYLPHGKPLITEKPLLGGEKDINLDNPIVKEALTAFTERVNNKMNTMYRVIPTDGRVTQQVVNGIIFRFKGMGMVTTTCKNNDESSKGKMTLKECPQYGEFSPKCTGSVFWDRQTFTVNEVTCK